VTFTFLLQSSVQIPCHLVKAKILHSPIKLLQTAIHWLLLVNCSYSFLDLGPCQLLKIIRQLWFIYIGDRIHIRKST